MPSLTTYIGPEAGVEKKGGGGLRTNNGQSAASSFNWPSARAAVRSGEAAAPAQGEARHAVSTASSVRGTRRAVIVD
jgi:hypothetical protein